MITGGAGGIGKSFAEQLASRRIDLFLIDFNQKLLSKTVTEIKEKYPKIRIKSKIMDLATLKNEDSFNLFAESIRNVKIGILFNNAGIALFRPLQFSTFKQNEITRYFSYFTSQFT